MSDEKDEDRRPSYERLQRERRSRLPDLGEPAERDYDLSARAFQPNEHATLARLMLDKNLDEQSKLQLYADVLGLRGVPDSVKRLQVPSFGVNYTRRFAGGGNTQMPPNNPFGSPGGMPQRPGMPPQRPGMPPQRPGMLPAPQGGMPFQSPSTPPPTRANGIAGAFQGINPAKAGYDVGTAAIMANQQQPQAQANQQAFQQQMQQQLQQLQQGGGMPGQGGGMPQSQALVNQQTMMRNGFSPEMANLRGAFDAQQQEAGRQFQQQLAAAPADQRQAMSESFMAQQRERDAQFRQQNPMFEQQANQLRQQSLAGQGGGMPGQLGGQISLSGQSGGLQPQFDPMPMKVQLSPEQQQQIALLNQQNAPRLQQELQQRIQQKFFDTQTANQFGNQGAMGLQPLQAAGSVGFQPQQTQANLGFQPQQTQANLGGMGTAFGGGLQGQFQAGMGNQFGMQQGAAGMGNQYQQSLPANLQTQANLGGAAGSLQQSFNAARVAPPLPSMSAPPGQQVNMFGAGAPMPQQQAPAGANFGVGPFGPGMDQQQLAAQFGGQGGMGTGMQGMSVGVPQTAMANQQRYTPR